MELNLIHKEEIQMDCIKMLQLAIEKKASDIFIVAGFPVSFRIKGIIKPVSEFALSPDTTSLMIKQLYELNKNRDPKLLEEEGEDDFAFSLSQIGRFRVNAYYQRGSKAAVLRVVNFILPRPEELHIPKRVVEFADLKKGLVLITGSAGCGKSTTLACLIDIINKKRNAHIITIEDPIEYLHKHNKSIVSQREIAHDTKSYINALRAALRESPDVILVGEMRDLETIQIALSAAETGHLVLSTLHTIGAANTIDRIIDVFPANQQQQIRIQLAMVLQAVVSQQLIPSKNNDEMLPSFEIMTSNNAIRAHIREGKTHQIENTILSNKEEGMLLLDDSILELYQKSLITKEDALLYCSNPDILKKKL